MTKLLAIIKYYVGIIRIRYEKEDTYNRNNDECGGHGEIFPLFCRKAGL
jgi:hypothetical protein